MLQILEVGFYLFFGAILSLGLFVLFIVVFIKTYDAWRWRD